MDSVVQQAWAEIIVRLHGSDVCIVGVFEESEADNRIIVGVDDSYYQSDYADLLVEVAHAVRTATDWQPVPSPRNDHFPF